MRTDVKIGIAVGLFLAIVASVYFFAVSGEDDPEPVVETPGPGPEEPIRVTVVNPEDTGLASTVPPVPVPETEAPTDGVTEDPPPPTVPPVTRSPIVIPLIGEEPPDDTPPRDNDRASVTSEIDDLLAAAARARTPATETLDDADRTVVVDTVITPVTSGAPAALRADPIESDAGDLTVPGAENFYSNVQRIYIVQHGDNGFWTVSARMYGHGKYFGVIAEANPNVDSSSLRPNQRLIVPPLPQKYRRKPVVPEPIGGFIGGQRTYVVRKGDAGFWGVSVKVYGHGKYYQQIAKANPGVNSETLSPGQRLVIPPKPADPSVRVTDGTGVTMPDLPGYKVYVVLRGDAGFWDVAVKMYGNGRHFGLVARANPGVDSRRLQPGQKLRIPPLGEVRRLTSAATAPYIEEGTGGITPVSADPRPIFE